MVKDKRDIRMVTVVTMVTISSDLAEELVHLASWQAEQVATTLPSAKKK